MALNCCSVHLCGGDPGVRSESPSRHLAPPPRPPHRDHPTGRVHSVRRESERDSAAMNPRPHAAPATPTRTHGPSRRALMRGAAWSVPVVAGATAAPAFALSCAPNSSSALARGKVLSGGLLSLECVSRPGPGPLEVAACRPLRRCCTRRECVAEHDAAGSLPRAGLRGTHGGTHRDAVTTDGRHPARRCRPSACAGPGDQTGSAAGSSPLSCATAICSLISSTNEITCSPPATGPPAS